VQYADHFPVALFQVQESIVVSWVCSLIADRHAVGCFSPRSLEISKAEEGEPVPNSESPMKPINDLMEAIVMTALGVTCEYS
jgi:hypothetical protein